MNLYRFAIFVAQRSPTCMPKPRGPQGKRKITRHVALLSHRRVTVGDRWRLPAIGGGQRAGARSGLVHRTRSWRFSDLSGGVGRRLPVSCAENAAANSEPSESANYDCEPPPTTAENRSEAAGQPARFRHLTLRGTARQTRLSTSWRSRGGLHEDGDVRAMLLTVLGVDLVLIAAGVVSYRPFLSQPGQPGLPDGPGRAGARVCRRGARGCPLVRSRAASGPADRRVRLGRSGAVGDREHLGGDAYRPACRAGRIWPRPRR